MKAEFGIPTQVDKLNESDSPAIVDKAQSETVWVYAVPRYMDKPEFRIFMRQMLPQAA